MLSWTRVMVSTNKKRLQSDGHFYVLRRKSLIQLVGEAGIEPTTPGLEDAALRFSAIYHPLP